LTIAALAVGMTISALRWVVVDSLHAYTGLPPPRLNFSRLGQNVAAFELLINIHYRHYQFYANMFVACVVAYTGYRVWLGADGVSGRSNAASDGRFKPSHFEETPIRSLHSEAHLEHSEDVWRIGSEWPSSRPSSRCGGAAGRVGGLPASWTLTARR
jgi:hypothetical protein